MPDTSADFHDNKYALFLEKAKELAGDRPYYLSPRGWLVRDVIDPTKKLPMDSLSRRRRNALIGAYAYVPVVPLIGDCFEITKDTIINTKTLSEFGVFLEETGLVKPETFNKLLTLLGVKDA